MSEPQFITVHLQRLDIFYGRVITVRADFVRLRRDVRTRPMVGKNDFNRNLRKKSRRSSHAGRAVRLPR